VRPGSRFSRQLGVEGAPVIDTTDPFRHGYGADALAFRFNRAGILSAPAYCQGSKRKRSPRQIASVCARRLIWLIGNT